MARLSEKPVLTAFGDGSTLVGTGPGLGRFTAQQVFEWIQAQLPSSGPGGGEGPALSGLPASPLAPTAQAGTAATASRSDHQHPYPNATQVGAAPTVHTHGIPGVDGLQGALDQRQLLSQKGQPNGYASLGADGLVPASQLASSSGGTGQIGLDNLTDVAIAGPNAQGMTIRYNGTQYVNSFLLQSDINGLVPVLDAKEVKSAKGQANGYASLDGTGKIPAAQIPASGSLPSNAVTTDYKAVVETINSRFDTTTGQLVWDPYSVVAADNNKVKITAGPGGSTDIKIYLTSQPIGTTIRFIQGSSNRIAFDFHPLSFGITIQSFSNFRRTGGQFAEAVATVVRTDTWQVSGQLVA